MNNRGQKNFNISVICIVFALLLNGCASKQKPDPRIQVLKNRLEMLQSNYELASRGGEALKRAENAFDYVNKNSHDLKDEDLSYSLYATDKLILLAEYSARAELADDKREELLDEQQKLVLQARTLEAQEARRFANQAQQDASEAARLKAQALADAEAAQKLRDIALSDKAEAERKKQMAQAAQQQAEAARESALSEAEKAKILADSEAEKARMARAEAKMEAQKAEAAMAEAAAAKAEMESLKNQLTDLQAKQTERGLLITLGDVLFEFNKSDLKSYAAQNLSSLVKALSDRQSQTVIVEGHTDGVGTRDYNLELSKKRAMSVKSYLVSKGIDQSRISIEGMGPDHPVATNDTKEGRSKNRRVEIILPQEE